ncbi:Cleavage stimulation factor subunit 1, partial [Galemys pyrenaicus]
MIYDSYVSIANSLINQIKPQFVCVLPEQPLHLKLQIENTIRILREKKMAVIQKVTPGIGIDLEFDAMIRLYFQVSEDETYTCPRENVGQKCHMPIVVMMNETVQQNMENHHDFYDTNTYQCFFSYSPQDQHNNTKCFNSRNSNANVRVWVANCMTGCIKLWDSVSDQCITTFEEAQKTAEDEHLSDTQVLTCTLACFNHRGLCCYLIKGPLAPVAETLWWPSDQNYSPWLTTVLCATSSTHPPPLTYDV